MYWVIGGYKHLDHCTQRYEAMLECVQKIKSEDENMQGLGMFGYD